MVRSGTEIRVADGHSDLLQELVYAEQRGEEHPFRSRWLEQLQGGRGRAPGLRGLRGAAGRPRRGVPPGSPASRELPGGGGGRSRGARRQQPARRRGGRDERPRLVARDRGRVLVRRGHLAVGARGEARRPRARPDLERAERVRGGLRSRRGTDRARHVARSTGHRLSEWSSTLRTPRRERLRTSSSGPRRAASLSVMPRAAPSTTIAATSRRATDGDRGARRSGLSDAAPPRGRSGPHRRSIASSITSTTRSRSLERSSRARRGLPQADRAATATGHHSQDGVDDRGDSRGARRAARLPPPASRHFAIEAIRKRMSRRRGRQSPPLPRVEPSSPRRIRSAIAFPR